MNHHQRQKLFANYMHTREHHSDTATDVSVAELLARYLRNLKFRQAY